jgi:hypothetical protein
MWLCDCFSSSRPLINRHSSTRVPCLHQENNFHTFIAPISLPWPSHNTRTKKCLKNFNLKSLTIRQSIQFKRKTSAKKTHQLLVNTYDVNPNDPYSGRTATLTSKRYILYIYSANISTEYFKHGIYSPFFSLQNAVCFIILTYLVPLLFTFYIQGVLKFKKIIPALKG